VVSTTTATRPEARDPGPAFHALSHAGRRQMLRLTGDRERTAGELAASCELTRPATSQHLKVLREAGLVSVRAVGNQRLYRAREAGLAELRAFIDSFWADRLDALRATVESDP
jgi:DNA-binding transcriptional ArsR family regulator